MPPAIQLPGTYIDEISGNRQNISGVAASITAFVGYTPQGPVNTAAPIKSFGDFEVQFGGLSNGSCLGFAVRDFFANGGMHAIIVRLVHADASIGTLAEAASPPEPLDAGDFLPVGGPANHKGLYALEQTEMFNLLCIPPYRGPGDALDVDTSVVAAAAAYCEERQAMLLLDAPKSWSTFDQALEGISNPNSNIVGTRSSNAALFFPRLRQPNPLRNGQIEDFATCGAVAGIFARTDATRGVWEAPAGPEATLHGVDQLSVSLTDSQIHQLNTQGINCLRNVAGRGLLVWGARTLRGADHFADDYKYVPVRRMALHIEKSLKHGLKWTAFEPNDERLRAQIRLKVNAFMHDLFRQGAFQGISLQQTCFVRCDSTTTSRNAINNGFANLLIGFAPLKPSEFLVLTLQVKAQQPAV